MNGAHGPWPLPDPGRSRRAEGALRTQGGEGALRTQGGARGNASTFETSSERP